MVGLAPVGLGVEGLQKGYCLFVAAFGEFACGCDTVARLEAVQPAVHGIVEEVDDGLAVVGHLAYDFGEGRWLIFCLGLGFCCEHVFYCNAGKRMGSMGGWRGWGIGGLFLVGGRG